MTASLARRCPASGRNSSTPVYPVPPMMPALIMVCPVETIVIARQTRSGRGVYDLQTRKVASVKTPVAGQQLLALNQRMGADQKIRRHAVAPSPASAIGPPRRTGPLRRNLFYSREFHAKRFHCLYEFRLIGKGGCRLAPYDGTRHHDTLGQAMPERLDRGTAEFRIGAENVEQDAGIDGGDHAAPRSSRNNASVPLPSLRQPYTRST